MIIILLYLQNDLNSSLAYEESMPKNRLNVKIKALAFLISSLCLYSDFHGACQTKHLPCFKLLYWVLSVADLANSKLIPEQQLHLGAESSFSSQCSQPS